MKKSKTIFIETPGGIFTSAGNWFHTTVEKLKSYAPHLFERRSMEEIIKDTEVWIRSADSLSITLFMVLLYLTGIQLALAVTLIFLPLWHLNKSAFVNLPASKIMKLIDNEVFLVLLSVLVLSWMGISEMYSSLILGLFFFLFLKFGWYRKLVDSLYHRRPQQLSLNDRVLKMVVVRYAMYEGVNVAEIRKMENDFLKMIDKKFKR